MPPPSPDLRRTWLFGPGADALAHDAMLRSGADVLIVDLEDLTTPSADDVRRATAVVEGFEAACTRGEDRALVEGLWVEVPTYRNARRLVERARRFEGQDRHDG